MYATATKAHPFGAARRDRVLSVFASASSRRCTTQGALEATQPIFLFAVAFGLSTDYAVFLLARIKEARDAGAPNDEAIALGLERTGRIVTAAALLFCVAVGAFATSQIVFLKQLGIGTALAVLIDATIVRALLVPALMALLGDATGGHHDRSRGCATASHSATKGRRPDRSGP